MKRVLYMMFVSFVRVLNKMFESTEGKQINGGGLQTKIKQKGTFSQWDAAVFLKLCHIFNSTENTIMMLLPSF